MEKYRSLFQNKFKSLKIFKLTNEEGLINKQNFKINQYSNVIVMPFTDDLDEVVKSVKLLFGTVGYVSYLKQYFIPKRFEYRRTLVVSPLRKETVNKEAIRDRLKSTLPRLSRIVDSKFYNKKNAIVDYSTIIEHVKVPQELLNKSPVLSKIELLIPEFLTYILMDDSDINVDSYSHTLGLKITAISEPRLFREFDRVVIPYRIDSLTKDILALYYLDSSQALPKRFKTDEKSIYDISLLRFLMRCVGRDYYDRSYEIYNRWIDKFVQKNPIFFFYNDKLGFIFDMRELQLIQKKNYNSIIKLLKDRVTTLIKVNNTELDDTNLDEYLNEQEEIEKKEAGIQVVSKLEDKKDKILDVKSGNNPDTTKEVRAITNTIIKQIANDSSKINVLKEAMKNAASDSEEIFKDAQEEDEKDIANDDESDDEIILKDLEDSDDFENEEEDEEVNLDDEDIEQKKEEKKQDEPKKEERELSEQEMKDILKVIDKDINKPKRTPKQEKRIKLVSQKWKSIKMEDNRTLEELLNDVKTSTIDPEIKNVPLRNKSLLNCTLVDFEKSYVKKQMPQDIVKVIKSFSENKEINLHITDLKKEDTSDQFTYKETYIVKFEDDNQKRHTLKFDLPKISEDGIIKINGNNKVLRKQLIFLPVVKNSPSTVWLTSYMNRTMIERNGQVLNRSTFILKKIIAEYLKPHPDVKILDGSSSKANKDKYLTTIEFDELADKFQEIHIKNKKTDIKFIFNIPNLMKEVESSAKLKSHLAKIQNHNILPIGINYNTGEVFAIDLNDKKGSVSELIINIINSTGIIPELPEIVKSTKAPARKTFLRIKLQSKDVPLIIFLSALFGFQNVINKAGIKVQVSDKPIKGDRRNVIKFKDCYLYYDSYPTYHAFLMNGLYYLPTEEFELVELESQMVYLEYLWNKFKSRNVIKGWYSFKELFLDPTTIQILKDFNQPTDFLELFLYAASLLDDNRYLHEGDKDNYRLRGYETIVELLYMALAEQYTSIKHHRKGTFSVPQDIVFAKLHTSQILANKDTLNPIMEIKDKGTVTMKGPSGTNLKQAYTMVKRSYDEKSVQIFALGTVDNSNTGVIKQLSINPNILSTRGYLNTKEDKSKTTYAQLYSFEEAVVPNLGKDDPSRANFATIQTSHLEESLGSHPPLVRTGAESILAYKIPENFVKKSKKEGIVMDVDTKNKKIFVSYKDGTKDVVEYGMELCRNSNFFVENDLECRVKKGTKLKAGDILAYNKGWFADEGDNVVYKSGPLARLIFLENESTEEDSSIMTKELALKMQSGVVKKKCITLRKNTLVHNYKRKGDHVLISEPLMGFEESSEEDTAKVIDLLGITEEELSNDLLRKTPKANATGEIRDVKIYWTCPLEEMHPSLRKMVSEYIKDIKSTASVNMQYTGKRDDRMLETEISLTNRGRINGEVMPEEGGVLVEYYISHKSGIVSGDKISYNSALKSVVAVIIPDELQPRTQSGIKIDCFIGILSSQARMINSIYINGLLGALLYRASMKYAIEFLNNIKIK